MKGRMVAYDGPQTKLYDKKEMSSPTLRNDLLMISLLVNGEENQKVSTGDVPGAYLHANLRDFTVIKSQDNPWTFCAASIRSTKDM